MTNKANMANAYTPAQRERVLRFYDGTSRWLVPAVESLIPDGAEVLARGRDAFEAMIDELPYVDRPEHMMAGSMFACASMLAVFEILRERALDAHAWGRAIHALPGAVPEADDEASAEGGRQDALASQSDAAANEFVWETVEGDSPSLSGMNITSCAICHLFSRHDAMELVPYMCSFDDVVSRAGDQGLRRTGTIALGASRCDFRFERGGEPLTLAEQYPEQIRLADRS